MFQLKKLKYFKKLCAKSLALVLTIGTLPIGFVGGDVKVAAAETEINYFQKSMYPVKVFTLRTGVNTPENPLYEAEGETEVSYLALQSDNTLAVTAKGEDAAKFELYSYGDGTSAIKCLNNDKYLSFKAYKPEYESVIKADAVTVGWNERFKVYDDGNGFKYITSHFTYNRDEEKRDSSKSRRLSLVTYKNQKHTLSLNAATPEQDTDKFVFMDVQAPAISLKIFSEVSANIAALTWDLVDGYSNVGNYDVKVIFDSKETPANTSISINGNKVTAFVSNLASGKEQILKVNLLDNNGNIITSKNVPVRIFNHPGIMHSEEELDLLKYHIDNKMEPWYSDWLRLKNSVPSNMSSLDFTTVARIGVGRGNPADSGKIVDFERAGLAAYLHALQWVATGDNRYADKAVEILNAWANTLKVVDGRDNILGAGINGYKFANAAEIIRYYKGGYAGYKTEDFKKLQNMMINVIYPVIQDFGVSMTANGNWDGAAYVTMISIGVLCDNTEIFNRAVNYYKSEDGNGSIKNYIVDSGQTQESGRDQAHAQLGIGYMAETCEVAWKQGLDLYSLENNRLFKAFEYSAKYNLFNDDVPFEAVPNVYGRTDIWSYWPDRLDQQSVNRGQLRPIYELGLSHYNGRLGMSAEWTQKAAEAMRPQGYVHNDNLNFGTLTQYNGPAVNNQLTPRFRLRTRQGDKYESTLTKLPDGSYTAETKESYLDLQPDNTLTVTSKRGSAPYFQLEAFEDGTYALKCLENNKYLSVKTDDYNVIKADAEAAGQNEKFKFYGNGNGYNYLTFPGLNNRRVSLVDTYKGYAYATYKGSNDNVTTDDKYLTLSLNATTPMKDTDMLIFMYDYVPSAPVIEAIGHKDIDENKTLNFTVSATIQYGHPLTYSAEGLPEGASLDAKTGEFKWTPEYSQAGQYNLKVTVSDGDFSSSEDISIKVNNITPEALISDTIEYIKGVDINAGVTQSLISKLNNVINSVQSENKTSSINKVNSFINEVNAQTDKGMTVEQASELKKLGEDIIANINATLLK